MQLMYLHNVATLQIDSEMNGQLPARSLLTASSRRVRRAVIHNLDACMNASQPDELPKRQSKSGRAGCAHAPSAHDHGLAPTVRLRYAGGLTVFGRGHRERRGHGGGQQNPAAIPTI
jgi:hypothetical protein